MKEGMKTRVCPSCKKEQPLKNFYTSISRCKSCYKRYQKEKKIEKEKEIMRILLNLPEINNIK